MEKIKPHEALDGKEYLSIFFLEKATNLESKVSYGDISYYERQELVRDDISRWRNWLDKNKCSLNLDNLMLMEKQIQDNNPWILVDE